MRGLIVYEVSALVYCNQLDCFVNEILTYEHILHSVFKVRCSKNSIFELRIAIHYNMWVCASPFLLGGGGETTVSPVGVIFFGKRFLSPSFDNGNAPEAFIKILTSAICKIIGSRSSLFAP